MLARQMEALNLGEEIKLLEAKLDSSNGMNYSKSTYKSEGGQDRHVFERRRMEVKMATDLSERHETVRDTRGGVERIELERRIGNRSRTVIKQRCGDEEHTRDTFGEVSEAERKRFDDDWTARTRNISRFWEEDRTRRLESSRYESRRVDSPQALSTDRSQARRSQARWHSESRLRFPAAATPPEPQTVGRTSHSRRPSTPRS